MNTREQVIETVRDMLPDMRARYGVETMSLFGSWARGDHHANSDIDLAVTFSTTPDLWEYVRLRDELSDRLGRPVDLVCRDTLRPLISERVAQEEILL